MLAAPLLLALPAAAQEQRAGSIAVSHPWTRAAGQGGTGAGFLTLRNTGSTPDRLVGASSPAARTTELHTHIREGEVMRMRPVPAIEIPAGQAVTLQPGGLHLMLIGLQQALDQGGSVPVTLRFERAGEVTVQLAVQAAGARGPMHH
ncbi:copper chaperone PCu(A)C [Roseicella aquatilis]|uniref:Copper chaperone PCu(A)C n=1 Tax=Roseicella aquatilis TaxID=2527868 RepID=A0A4R4DNE0_9PROT|nr:copper chaperone PCu(A)C [Roseicella aquatilis]